ncbi:FG-GAP-like repeat-containing protein, partial [Candidatus Bathyarchaeota archaeon]|nr:FG-GAP-like repeat-containing protein [Candidatus Bathyarchaeota archaeon]
DGSVVTGFPILFASSIQRGVAVGDITGDNVPEIVFGFFSSDPELLAITVEGDTVPNFPVILDSYVNTTPIISKVVGGSTEYHIFTTTINHDLVRIDLDGTQTNLYSSSSPINSNLSLCDINNDQALDIVFGTDAGRLYAFNFNGDSLQNFPVQLDGKISVSPVFADFNNDNQVEIVVSTDAGNLYILNNDGTNYINSPAAFTHSLTGSPCIDDLDSDGDLEIMVGGGDGLNILDVPGTKNDKLYWYSYMSDNLRGGYLVFKPILTIIEKIPSVPISSQLLQNYPNPFNPITTIEYTLSDPSRVVLAVYNILGQHICTLIQENQNGGIHKKVWEGTDENGNRVVSGVYFYKLTIETEDGQINNYIRKMLLVR